MTTCRDASPDRHAVSMSITMSMRLFVFTFFFGSLPAVVFGGLITSEAHPHFGADSITRDHNQGLDFLDLTHSLGRSYNDISGE